MAPHSSTLVWKILWTEEPGGLQSMGSQRVGHDWATSLSLFTFLHWRRKWQPTPVFLPGESQGQGSLVGCRLWGRRVGHDWSDLAASLLYSIVFLYFFALIADEGFLISPCCSLELWIQMVYLSFSPLLLTSLLFTAICKASSDSHFHFLHFFSIGMVLIPVSCTMSQTSVHSSSGTLSVRSSPLNLFLTSTV